MTTKVYCSRGTRHYDRLGYRIILKNLDRSKCDFEVVSWEKGIVTLNNATSCDKFTWAQTIAGCFDNDSNFVLVLRKYYGDNRKKKVKGIQFKYFGSMILITKRSAKAAIIVRKMEEQKLLYDKQQLEYNKKYDKICFKEDIMELKEEYRESILKEKIQEVSSSSDVEFKDEFAREMWEEFVKLNSNDTSFSTVISQANDFAKYVQYLIKTHNKPLCYFAERVMELTRIDVYYYSNVIIEMLCMCWAYGDELFNFCKEHKVCNIANEVGM